MARSTHATYTAVDRYERRAARRPRPADRRTNTRHAIIAHALQEG